MIIDGKEWRLVPVEAVREMLDAAHFGPNCAEEGLSASDEKFWIDVWNAMLNSAPQPPEVVVSDEMAKKVAHYYHHHPVRNSNAADGRDMIDAVQSILGPALGMVELKEPTPEECERICTAYERLLMRVETCGGRDAFDAVRAVMWPKEGL